MSAFSGVKLILIYPRPGVAFQSPHHLHIDNKKPVEHDVWSGGRDD